MSNKPAAKTTERRRASAPQQDQFAEGDPEELLHVNVPKAFQYIAPDTIMHKFAAGEQNMRRKFATASYAKSHGVVILGEAQ